MRRQAVAGVADEAMGEATPEKLVRRKPSMLPPRHDPLATLRSQTSLQLLETPVVFAHETAAQNVANLVHFPIFGDWRFHDRHRCCQGAAPGFFFLFICMTRSFDGRRQHQVGEDRRGYVRHRHPCSAKWVRI